MHTETNAAANAAISMMGAGSVTVHTSEWDKVQPWRLCCKQTVGLIGDCVCEVVFSLCLAQRQQIKHFLQSVNNLSEVTVVHWLEKRPVLPVMSGSVLLVNPCDSC